MRNISSQLFKNSLAGVLQVSKNNYRPRIIVSARKGIAMVVCTPAQHSSLDVKIASTDAKTKRALFKPFSRRFGTLTGIDRWRFRNHASNQHKPAKTNSSPAVSSTSSSPWFTVTLGPPVSLRLEDRRWASASMKMF